MKCNFCVFIERNVYIQKNRLYESTSGQYTYKNTYTYIQSIKDEAINLSVYIYLLASIHTASQIAIHPSSSCPQLEFCIQLSYYCVIFQIAIFQTFLMQMHCKNKETVSQDYFYYFFKQSFIYNIHTFWFVFVFFELKRI